MRRRIQHKEFLKWLQLNVPNGVVLDVGCGNKWYWSHIQAQFIGIDAWPDFEPNYLLDLQFDNLPDVNADAVLLLDVLEHLDKPRGLQILEQAKTLAPYVVVLTPLVFTLNAEAMQDRESDYYNNPYEIHKCLYRVEDFVGFERIPNMFALSQYFHGVWRA